MKPQENENQSEGNQGPGLPEPGPSGPGRNFLLLAFPSLFDRLLGRTIRIWMDMGVLR